MRRLAAACALCLVALAGCGDGEEGDPPAELTTAQQDGRLTRAERDLVEDSEVAIVDYCRRVTQSLTRPDKRPTVNQQAHALEAVDALIALAGEKPDARVDRGVAMIVYVGDLAENLQGANCDPAIVARLDAGLGTLPSR